MDTCTFLSFQKVQVEGMENIPDDGAVIFAPNHCNTLMDALVVLRTRTEPTVFGARADMFENPTAAKALHFLKIVPMVRKRDGIRKVIRNLDIIDDIVEVLGENVPFGIFPEGTHRPMHSLLPVGKGVFRIAVTANNELNNKIYVVPVGIEYGDYYRYASTSLVQFGQPVAVTDFIAQFAELPEAERYREMTAELRDRIAGLITYIPDDEDYEAKWAYTKIMTAGPKPSDLRERLKNNQDVIANIDASKLPAALEFDAERKEAKISYHSLGYKHMFLRTLLKTFGLILWAPVQVLAGVADLPSIAVAEYLIANKVKDKAFGNSLRMASSLLINEIILIIWTFVAIFSKISFWKVGIPVMLLLQFAPLAFYSGLEWYRVWLSDIRLLFNGRIAAKFAEIRK
ncbi:MAG: 1-acyl-sn-glycerol-3-phosphate acyltransferase [Bacteroidia bacterium]|nr:1-acyl-sn-glycerol-3-phosphate acyltransferase [Bacteroidia bacterium]